MHDALSGQVERAFLDRRGAGSRPRQAAHEQPGARQARREGHREGAPRATIRCCVKDVVLYPNLGDPVSRPAKEVGVLLHGLSGAGGRSPESRIELLQNGKLVAQMPMPLAAGRRVGPRPAAGRLPIEQLPPGTYELRAIVKQGDEQVVRDRRCCGSRSESFMTPAHRRSPRSSLSACVGRRLSSGDQRGRAASAIAGAHLHGRPRSSSTSSCATSNGRPVLDLVRSRLSSSPRTASGRGSTRFTRVSRGGGIGVGVAWRAPRHDRRRRLPPQVPRTRRPIAPRRRRRRRRSCSISSRPNRCGWRSARRSTTSR